MSELAQPKNRAYLQSEVYPTLVKGLEELLKASERHDEQLKVGVDVREPLFNPVNWLAEYLMRHNARHKTSLPSGSTTK